jgi:hypothetical protein
VRRDRGESQKTQLGYGVLALMLYTHIFAIILLLWPGLIGLQAALAGDSPTLAPTEPADTFFHYLPLVQYFPPEPNPAIIEAVKTAQGVREGYPSTYYAFGYVRNLTNGPLYDVLIDMEVTIFPYADPPADPYTEIVHLTPALTATLPGQLNPFSYRLYLGKASASIGPIVNVSASPWSSGDPYYPLTIVGYVYEDAIVSGTARNDSGLSLQNARIVGLEPYHCGWREAALGADELLPGQVITFTIPFGASCEVDDRLIVSGQGAFR